MPAPLVQASTLTKAFGSRVAVAGVDFSLAGAQCLSVFGPNGAGKTTLLRLIAGLLKPTSGTIRLAGADARGDAASRGRIGLISHHTMLYAPLTALENVEFFARLHGVEHPANAARRALEAIGMADRAQAPVRTLSRGMQQRVSIARAVVHSPSVLLLDEPYSGLDETAAITLTSMLRQLRDDGAALIVVTHHVSEGLALATHAATMAGGRFTKFEERASAA